MDEIDEARVRATLDARSASAASAPAMGGERAWTGNRDVDRLLPAILTIVLWMLCARMMESAPSYARGLVDGAFALIAVRVAWGMKEAFMGGSSADRDALRWGVVWGVAGVIAAAGVWLMVR